MRNIYEGLYLFHIHTDWTDGESILADYCVAAKKQGFQKVILTEHIRRNSSYDFRAFLDHVKEQESTQDVQIIVGVEAKILPNGLLDIPEWILPEIEVLAIAEHSFNGDAIAMADALMQNFKSLRNTKFAKAWVHPGLGLLLKKSAPVFLFQRVVETALKFDINIELNLKYRLPPESLFPLIPSSSLIIGLDAHSVREVEMLADEAIQHEMKLASADSDK